MKFVFILFWRWLRERGDAITGKSGATNKRILNYYRACDDSRWCYYHYYYYRNEHYANFNLITKVFFFFIYNRLFSFSGCWRSSWIATTRSGQTETVIFQLSHERLYNVIFHRTLRWNSVINRKFWSTVQ